jgi:hypothetical protein
MSNEYRDMMKSFIDAVNIQPKLTKTPAGLVLPAGEYYIGDPCYVIPNDDWHDYCDALHELGYPGDPHYPYNPEKAVFEYKGMKCFSHSTAFGDGGYQGTDGVHYSVDSGTIGAVPASLAVGKRARKEAERLGSFKTFDQPFEVGYNNGMFTIGDIKIETNWDNMPDEDEDLE